jgi:hypothetical protein
MKNRVLTVLCASALSCVHAQDDARAAALTTADNARVGAMLHPDTAALGAAFSDELRYAHSNGIVDTKASLMDTLLQGRTKYLTYDYEERKFTFPAPEIALMSGRARIKAVTASGEMDSVLSYLSVWRLEKGQWRFLAWQSCRLPAAKP